MGYRPRTFQKREYDPTKVEIAERTQAGSPTAPKASEQTAFSRKTIKDLQIGGSITVKADPLRTASEASTPYQYIAENNKIIDRSYKGETNLSGNILPLILNDGSSKLLKQFDAAICKLDFRYLYMATRSTDKNTAVNREMLKTFDEAVSKAYAESFVKLPIFDYTISTGIPKLNGSVLALLVAYQIHLQQIAYLINSYNLLLAMEKHLKGMVWNRDETVLNEVFGLMKKSSLRARFNAIATATYGEYFDVQWAEQFNSIVMVPSRRTKGFKTPILFTYGKHVVDTVTATAEIAGETQTVFDNTGWGGTSINTATLLLNPYQMLRYVRQRSVNPEAVTTTPDEIYNSLCDALDLVIDGLTIFKGEAVQIRVMLEVINRVGLNNWKQGVKLTTTTISDYEPVYNKLLADIYTSCFSGSENLTYDTNSRRWKMFSLWNRYYGIPEYERVSGGAFILFSTRGIPNDSSYDSSKYLVPIMFTLDGTGSSHKVLNRLGEEFDITTLSLNNATIEAHSVFTRLNALSNSDLTIKIPKLGASTTSVLIKTMMIDVLMEIFGLGAVQRGSSDYYEFVHPDSLCFIDTEIDDVTNSMITFCKSHGPLRINKPVSMEIS